MIDLHMPSPAEGIDEVVIARWLKKEGDPVAVGDDLFEIETDKVTMIHVAESSGILQIVEPEGSVVAIGAVIAHLLQTPVAEDAPPAASPEASADAPAAPTPVTAAVPEPEISAPIVAKASAESPAAQTPSAAATPEPGISAPIVATATARTAQAGIRATPLARLIAGKDGIDLSVITGSGPFGLITRADVTGKPGTKVPPTGNDRARVSTSSKPTLEPLTRVQQVIARRMVEAKNTIPEFQVETEAAVDDLLALRGRIKELGDVAVPSVNDFIIKAAALALREHPRVNASFQDDHFLLHPNVNVGFAVAATDALIVPTVRDADTLPLPQIAAETRRLAERARSGSLTADEVTGGTFTVSNLGMYGMTAITPIINAPQAAILGVAAPRESLFIAADEVVKRRSLMTLTLSCDHRILYGADAAAFLSSIRSLLEQPLRLILDSNA